MCIYSKTIPKIVIGLLPSQLLQALVVTDRSLWRLRSRLRLGHRGPSGRTDFAGHLVGSAEPSTVDPSDRLNGRSEKMGHDPAGRPKIRSVCTYTLYTIQYICVPCLARYETLRLLAVQRLLHFASKDAGCQDNSRKFSCEKLLHVAQPYLKPLSGQAFRRVRTAYQSLPSTSLGNQRW